jgi:flagellar biosynthesis GTPase FlhF
MRISKLLSAVCAAAFLAGSLAVRAQDNPAQAAARAALKDKMSGLDAQQNQPAPPVILAAPSGAVPEQAGQPANAAPEVERTPKTTDDNAVMTPVNKPASKEDKAIAKAEKAAAAAKAKQEADQAAADLKAKKEADRKAAEQKAADEAAAKAQAKAKADAQQAAAELKAKKEAEPAAKAQVGAQPSAPLADNSGIFTPVPPPSNPGVQPGVKAAPTGTPPLSDQWQNPPPTKSAAPPAKPAAPAVAPAVKPVPANASYAGKTLGFKPVEAPPPPVSAQKQAELQTLLARYMANQISPDEYQKERAAILAAP